MKPFKEGRINPEDLKKALDKGAIKVPQPKRINDSWDRFIRRQIRSLERDYDFFDDYGDYDPDEGDR